MESTTPPSDPSIGSAAATSEQSHHGLIAASFEAYELECELPAPHRGARFSALTPVESTVDSRGYLHAVVFAPDGVGLLQRKGAPDHVLRWQLARSGDRCTIQPAPMVPIRGRVVDSQGQPVLGAKLSGCGAFASSDESGAFQTELRLTTPWVWGISDAVCLLTATDQGGRSTGRLVPMLSEVPTSIRLQLPADPSTPQPLSLAVALELPPTADRTERLDLTLPNHSEFVEVLRRQRSTTTVPPHSLEELRASLSRGTIATFEVQAKDTPPRQVTWTFGAQTSEGVTVQITATEGNTALQPTNEHMTWRQLRYQHTFHRPSTKVTRRSTFTPMGSLEGWFYLSSLDSSLSTLIQTADSLPGLPVYAETRQEGEVVHSSKLKRFTPGPL